MSIPVGGFLDCCLSSSPANLSPRKTWNQRVGAQRGCKVLDQHHPAREAQSTESGVMEEPLMGQQGPGADPISASLSCSLDPFPF